MRTPITRLNRHVDLAVFFPVRPDPKGARLMPLLRHLGVFSVPPVIHSEKTGYSACPTKRLNPWVKSTTIRWAFSHSALVKTPTGFVMAVTIRRSNALQTVIHELILDLNHALSCDLDHVIMRRTLL